MGGSGYHILSRFPPVNMDNLLDSYYAGQALDFWSGNPHSYYLATVLETGVFSLLLQMIFFGILLRAGIRVVRQTPSVRHRALAIGGATVLGLEFLRGLFESYAFFGAPESAAIVVFACAVLLYLEDRLPLPSAGTISNEAKGMMAGVESEYRR